MSPPLPRERTRASSTVQTVTRGPHAVSPRRSPRASIAAASSARVASQLFVGSNSATRAPAWSSGQTFSSAFVPAYEA